MHRNYNTDHITFSFKQLLAFVAIFFVTLASLSSETFGQGKLGRVRSAVRQAPPQPRPQPKPRQEHHSNHDDDDNDDRHDHNNDRHARRNDQNDNHRNSRPRRQSHRRDSRAAGLIFLGSPQPICDPIIIPVMAHPRNEFLPSPVVVAQETLICPIVEPAPVPMPTVVEHVVVAPTVIEQVPVQAEPYSWFEQETSRVWATLGSDFDGLTTVGLGFQFQAPGSLGLEGSVVTLRESGVSFRDHLWLGDVNVTYEFLSGPNVRGRMGIGVNWLGDQWGGEAGLNLTAGVDLRLTDRLVLSGEGDVGTLGDADFFHGRVSLARRFEGCELVLGADHFNIGGAEMNSYFTGVQFRF